ncbi:MAG: response regulator [Burkholderiales bacterium]
MAPGPTILVIEDNPTARKMLCLALATEGYGVVEAADARAALAVADRTLPDLVLQDLILPDMDGLELLRRLRALPGGTELPILALSGFLSRLEEVQTDRQGFTALLVKPIEPSRLTEAIRVYLPQPPALETSFGHGRRLLVVDDDPVQLKLTRIHFSQLGFQVAAVNGASDALVAARANRPDVILSDVFMPGSDGFDLCLEIRRDPNLTNVPVVLLSGQYGSKADEDLARRVGANALLLRTPDFANVAAAILKALQTRAPTPAEQPNDQLALAHARLVIHQLERQAAATAGLSQRCGIQAGQLSLLSGVADALTRKSDPDVALRDVLAATLDAAGISKGALILRDETGALKLRQDIGFSETERAKLQKFFGHSALLEDIVNGGGSVSVPSAAIPAATSRDVLTGANVTAAQIVPLVSDGRGVGAMIIGATTKDVTSDDSVAFARAMGNQIVQSLALARSVARLSEERNRAQLAAAVGLALADSDAFAHALQRCAEALVTHLGAALARIWTLNEPGGVLELQASAGLYTHLNGPHGRVPLGQFKIGWIARDRKPYLTNSVIGDPDIDDQEWAQREGIVAFAGHQLIVDDRVVGVMALFVRHPRSAAQTACAPRWSAVPRRFGGVRCRVRRDLRQKSAPR